MRHLKLMLVAFALTFYAGAFANSSSDDELRRGSVSYEIGKMLANSDLVIEEEFTVKVVFKVNKDNRIEIRSISSPNETVNEFLQERLDNQKLHGSRWDAEKIYELPVKVETRR